MKIKILLIGTLVFNFVSYYLKPILSLIFFIKHLGFHFRQNSTIHIFIFLMYFFQSNHLLGQVNFDNTFASNGRFFYNETGTDEKGVEIIEQTDGKIILVGETDFDPDEANNYRIIVMRLNVNGTFDNSFGINGKVYIDTQNSSDRASAAALQQDGKILICGLKKIYRLNSNGNFDNSFGSNGVATISSESSYDLKNIKLQTNGKIVVSGYGFIDSRFSYLIARFNVNGQLDNTFNGTGFTKVRTSTLNTEEDDAAGIGLAIQTDGKIVTCGYNEKQDGTILRFTDSGHLDATFGSGGIKMINLSRKLYLYSVAIQSDGKILIGGTYDFSSSLIKAVVFRFLTNGNSDNTFNNSGSNFFSSPTGFGIGYDMSLQCDGKIIIGGLDLLNRALPDGNPDVTFAGNNSGFFDLNFTPSNNIIKMSLTSTKIYLVGWSTQSSNSSDKGMLILRLNNDTNCGTTSTIDNNGGFGLITYPNPTSDFITIEGNVEKIEIFNSAGQKMSITNGAKYDDQTIIDVSNFVNGIYMVNIQVAGQVKSSRFIKI